MSRPIHTRTHHALPHCGARYWASEGAVPDSNPWEYIADTRLDSIQLSYIGNDGDRYFADYSCVAGGQVRPPFLRRCDARTRVVSLLPGCLPSTLPVGNSLPAVQSIVSRPRALTRAPTA